MADQITNFPSKYYYSNSNKMYALGKEYVGECTWFCWGRALETVGTTRAAVLPTSGAGSWYKNTTSKKKLGPDEIPSMLAIACFSGGHVAFIETVSKPISGDPKVSFTEANWYVQGDPKLSNGKVEIPPDGTDGTIKVMSWPAFTKRGPGTYLGAIVL